MRPSRVPRVAARVSHACSSFTPRRLREVGALTLSRLCTSGRAARPFAFLVACGLRVLALFCALAQAPARFWNPMRAFARLRTSARFSTHPGALSTPRLDFRARRAPISAMDVESRSDCPSARSGKPARLPGRLRASAPSGRLCASVRAAPLRDSTERFCAPMRMFRASARFFLSGSAGPRAAARLLLQFSTARCAPVRFLRVTAECAPPRPSDRFRPSASARASARLCALLRASAPLRLRALRRAPSNVPLRDSARFCAPVRVSSPRQPSANCAQIARLGANAKPRPGTRARICTWIARLGA